MQNPNKPIGLSLLFKSLCGLGTGKILGAIEYNVLCVAESRVQHCHEKITEAQLQPVIVQGEGGSLHEAATVHGSASGQTLGLGGKAPGGDGEREPGSFNLDPSSKYAGIWQIAQLGLRS